MRDQQAAKRYYVSGTVQGVGYRYFARGVALRFNIAGYVKNLRDGRVEVYAVGAESNLRGFCEVLERGPAGASVSGVKEEEALVNPEFIAAFSIEYDD